MRIYFPLSDMSCIRRGGEKKSLSDREIIARVIIDWEIFSFVYRSATCYDRLRRLSQVHNSRRDFNWLLDVSRNAAIY